MYCKSVDYANFLKHAKVQIILSRHTLLLIKKATPKTLIAVGFLNEMTFDDMGIVRVLVVLFDGL